MGADILEALQLRSKPLDEDRSRRQRGAKPVSVLCDVAGEAEERPRVAETALLMSESLRIGQCPRPVRFESDVTLKAMSPRRAMSITPPEAHSADSNGRRNT